MLFFKRRLFPSRTDGPFLGIVWGNTISVRYCSTWLPLFGHFRAWALGCSGSILFAHVPENTAKVALKVNFSEVGLLSFW